MNRLPLVALLSVAASFVAACAGGNQESEAAATGNQDLSIVELKCAAGSMHFDVEPTFGGAILGGTLKTDALTTEFVCKTPGVDAGPNLVVSCAERPQSVHPGRWTVEVTKDADGEHARIAGEGAPTDALSCDAPKDDTPVLPYATIAGYVENTCGPCHGDAFDSLAKIKAQREIMLGLVSSGAMPRQNPTWKNTPEGKAVIAFLTKSPELEQRSTDSK
jgi:hypothetical protein